MYKPKNTHHLVPAEFYQLAIIGLTKDDVIKMVRAHTLKPLEFNLQKKIKSPIVGIQNLEGNKIYLWSLLIDPLYRTEKKVHVALYDIHTKEVKLLFNSAVKHQLVSVHPYVVRRMEGENLIEQPMMVVDGPRKTAFIELYPNAKPSQKNERVTTYREKRGYDFFYAVVPNGKQQFVTLDITGDVEVRTMQMQVPENTSTITIPGVNIAQTLVVNRTLLLGDYLFTALRNDELYTTTIYAVNLSNQKVQHFQYPGVRCSFEVIQGRLLTFGSTDNPNEISVINLSTQAVEGSIKVDAKVLSLVAFRNTYIFISTSAALHAYDFERKTFVKLRGSLKVMAGCHQLIVADVLPRTERNIAEFQVKTWQHAQTGLFCDVVIVT